MAATKNHDYHLVEPDPWPLIGALSGGILFSGLVMWLHDNRYGKFVFALGLLGVLVTMYNWWSNTIREAHTGYHTPVVQLHLRYGMILFIASEVMFFLAWFWAFFDSSLFPSAVEAVGGMWPPKGIEVLNPWGFPLLNTLILLCSGTTVTWAHHSLIHGDRDGLKLGLWLTILLGLLFTSIQAYEYAHAPFAFKGSIYGSTFFMATGFHGFHVIVGTIFLIVCLIRAYKGDFTPQAAFRLRGGRLVLAFRRRRVAVPVHVDLRLGRLGRAAPRVSGGGLVTEPSPAASALRGHCPRCGAHTLFDGWVRFADRCRELRARLRQLQRRRRAGGFPDLHRRDDRRRRRAGRRRRLLAALVGASHLDSGRRGADHRRPAAVEGLAARRRNISIARAKGGSRE